MMHIQCLEELVRRDPRYAYEAYEFVFAALAHTQKMLGRVPQEPAEEPAEEPSEESAAVEHHVSGPELLDGIRDLALREFGLMARTVFRMWGIESTGDFGEIVFNLIEANLMSKTEGDSRADFVGVYDLDQALVHDYRIVLDEVE
ncbi:MAG TPA: Minf_1886 family protein [Gemmataceae bacterium]|nr:Minf_1886 family protein [Gemmataceae bacterium]